mgnify:CR=1 FL=1
MTGNCLRGSRPFLSFDEHFAAQPHLQLVKEMLCHVCVKSDCSRGGGCMCVCVVCVCCWLSPHRACCVSRCLAHPEVTRKASPSTTMSWPSTFWTTRFGCATTKWPMLHRTRLRRRVCFVLATNPRCSWRLAHGRSLQRASTGVFARHSHPLDILILCFVLFCFGFLCSFVLDIVRIFSGSFGGPTLYQNADYVSPNAMRHQRRLALGQQFGNRQEQRELTKQRRDSRPRVHDELADVFK